MTTLVSVIFTTFISVAKLLSGIISHWLIIFPILTLIGRRCVSGDEAVRIPAVLPAGGGGPCRPARGHQPAGPGQRRRTLYSRHGRPLGQRPHAAGRHQFPTICANCSILKNEHLVIILNVFIGFVACYCH
jgi:hypothetical protein